MNTVLHVDFASSRLSAQRVPAKSALTARTKARILISQVVRRVREARAMASPRGWMTFEEVKEYLGHTVPESTEVWLSRHGITPTRHYKVKEVVSAREPHKAGTKTKPLRSV